MPASTGATAAGSVRGRAPSSHCAGVAMVAGSLSGGAAAVSVARVISLRPVSGTADEITGLLADWLAAPAAEPLLIETSGSTGRPKQVSLSRDAVVASARAAHDRLGGPGRWTLLLPPSYVAGVQVIVRALLAGRRAGPGADAPDEGTVLRLGGAHPARADARPPGGPRPAAQLRRRAGGRRVRSTRPCGRARGEAGVRVVATYGMSETCRRLRVRRHAAGRGGGRSSAPTGGCGWPGRCSSTGTSATRS